MPIHAQSDFPFNFIVGGGGGERGELSCLNRNLEKVLKQPRPQGLSS